MHPYSTPLNRNRREIRRLALLPKSAGSAIVCSCETVSLLDDPDYEALSYVWGDASSQDTITFGGSTVSVTANLAAALSHLRLADQPRLLWIDALCINQSSPDEKSQQVLMMGDIYKGARPVLVWLGEADAQSSACFESILEFASQDDMPWEKKNDLFSFYFDLVEKRWFSRVWTIQELVLATHDPLVGCGNQWIPWNTLASVWQRLAIEAFTDMDMVIARQPGCDKPSDLGEPLVRTTATRLDLLHDLRTVVRSKGGETLRDLLLRTVTADATNPRDRIYSLLGMMHPEDRKHISVNYRYSVGQVFACAVAHLGSKNQATFFLSGVTLSGDSGDASCPSWVPRFGSRALLTPTSYHPPGIGVSGVGSECVNGVVDPDLRTFRVRGMYVDTVHARIDFRGSRCLDRLAEVELMAIAAQQIAASHSHHRPYLRDFKSREPLWRTLIANKAYTGAERQMAPEADYARQLVNKLQHSCFFITETGFCGIGSTAISPGDHLAIWFGAPVTFVLRSCTPPAQATEVSEPVYTVHGVAYVAGIMDGEMVDQVYCEDLEDDTTYMVV
ncbi:heterokaryon incompatibility protein-domain-containing protein [Xylariales sp. PMI_506]|nr:heterokaryon incompatibility protein-domain-containing protein [Xylariales sp. PMI_506]